jgi:hypothetical protein
MEICDDLSQFEVDGAAPLPVAIVQSEHKEETCEN